MIFILLVVVFPDEFGVELVAVLERVLVEDLVEGVSVVVLVLNVTDSDVVLVLVVNGTDLDVVLDCIVSVTSDDSIETIVVIFSSLGIFVNPKILNIDSMSYFECNIVIISSKVDSTLQSS